MKKLLIFLLFITMLCMAACANGNTDGNADTPPVGDITTPTEAPLSYAGVSAAFVGDSITNGATLEQGDPIYWQLVKESLQLGDVTGMGVNGSCYSTKSEFGLEHEPLAIRYQQIPQTDMIFIALGTNDFGRSTPMGTIEDQEDVSFYGAMNMILTALEEQCSDSQIILLTPIVRHDKSVNNLGLEITDYIAAIKAVAQERNLPVVDMYELTRNSLSQGVFTDGVHLDKYGHQILAQTLETWLKDNMETVLH